MSSFVTCSQVFKPLSSCSILCFTNESLDHKGVEHLEEASKFVSKFPCRTFVYCTLSGGSWHIFSCRTYMCAHALGPAGCACWGFWALDKFSDIYLVSKSGFPLQEVLYTCCLPVKPLCGCVLSTHTLWTAGVHAFGPWWPLIFSLAYTCPLNMAAFTSLLPEIYNKMEPVHFKSKAIQNGVCENTQ